MPTYEYRCNGCNREFEVQQRMSDPDLVTCEICGADKLEKLISWTSVRSGRSDSALYGNPSKEINSGAFNRPQPKPKANEPATSAETTPAATGAAPTTPDATTPAATGAGPTRPAATTPAAVSSETLDEDEDDEGATPPTER